MPTPKPPYPAAFRQQMVELVRAGRGISELSREFGCNASSIHAWVKAAGGLDGSGATSVDAPLSMNERQELIELRRKLKQVQQERDILANDSRDVPRPFEKKLPAPTLLRRPDPRPLAFWRLMTP
ncbi:MAG: transposase [Chitinophagaceae bacterium]|nr:transposase [Rubrivivax sp.]